MSSANHDVIVADYLEACAKTARSFEQDMKQPAVYSKKYFDICMRVHARFHAIGEGNMAEVFYNLAEMYRASAINSVGAELVQW
jgi:hypothetical protein